jgi:hypothetical protein
MSQPAKDRRSYEKDKKREIFVFVQCPQKGSRDAVIWFSGSPK